VKQYFGFVQPDFVPVVLNEQGQMVAFGITMPSLSRALQKVRGELFPVGFFHLLKALKTYDTFDLYLVAVRKESQGKGVNAILMDHIHRLFVRLGIKKVESNPELENNADVQGQWKYYPRVTIQPCHCEPFLGDREAYPKGKQSPVYQASLTAWGLLRRKERSSQ